MKNTKFIPICLCVSLLIAGCRSYSDKDFAETKDLFTTETLCLTCSTEETIITVSETETTPLSDVTTEIVITTEMPQSDTTYCETSETTEVTTRDEPWYWCWTDYEDTILNIYDYPSETVVTAELICPIEETTVSTTDKAITSPPETVVSTTTADTTVEPDPPVSITNDTVSNEEEQVSFIDDYTRKYYYNTLTESQKKYYRFCFKQKRYLVNDVKPNIPESDQKIARFAMNRDNPHLLLYPTQYSIDNGFTSMTKEKRDKILKMANDIAVRAQEYSRTFDRLKFIHDELSNIIEYMSSHDMISAFMNGKANCSGYADAFCMVCQLAEIDCVVVHGTADNGNGPAEHAWNMVKLGDTWYNVDVCWDDVKFGRYSYFLRSDKAFSMDHYVNMPIICPTAPKRYPVDYLGNETM